MSALVAAVDLGSQGGPSLKANVGYLNYVVSPSADGTFLPSSSTISLTSTGDPIRFRVTPPGDGSLVSVSPVEGVTPAQITLTTAATTSGTTLPVFILETGAAEAMTVIPVFSAAVNPFYNFSPPSIFASVIPGQTITATVTISAFASVPGPIQPLQVPFQFSRETPIPGLTLSASKGVTPATISLTFNPTGLTAGTYFERWVSRQWSYQVVLAVPTPGPSQPAFTGTPGQLNFSFPSAAGAQTQTVHVTTTDGSPQNFTVATTPTYLSIMPESGTTPADLTITVDASKITGSGRHDYVILMNASLLQNICDIVTNVGYALTGPRPYSSASGSDVTPGSLVILNATNLAVTAKATGAPWPTTLGGVMVTVNGVAIPLSSISSGSIQAQMPYGIAPGTATALLQRQDGTVLASSSFRIVANPTPSIPVGGSGLALKADGSRVTPANPVMAGDVVLVEFTAQGPLAQPLAAGTLPAPGVSIAAASPVTAEVGGLTAQVISAQASSTDVGQFEVRLRVPDLAAGDQYIRVFVGTAVLDGVPLRVANSATPSVNLNGVVNGASFAQGAVAPGSLVSAFGLNLATTASNASTVPLPLQLGGATFTLGGIATPLLLTSAQQVNFQVPWELAGQPSAAFSETLNNLMTPFGQSVSITTYSPAIFVAKGTQGVAIIHGTALLAGPILPGSRPAHRGEFLEVYATGLGSVTNTPATGDFSPSNPIANTVTMATATIGGVNAPVSFSGLAPGFVGLYQVNVQVPPDAPTGNAVPLVVQMENVSSNTVTIAIVP